MAIEAAKVRANATNKVIFDFIRCYSSNQNLLKQFIARIGWRYR